MVATSERSRRQSRGWESGRSVLEEREAKGRDAAAEQVCQDGLPSDRHPPGHQRGHPRRLMALDGVFRNVRVAQEGGRNF